MRETQRFQKITDHPFAVREIEAVLDHLLQIDAPPTDHTITFWIRTGLDDLAKFNHLCIVEVARPSQSRDQSGHSALGTFLGSI